MWPGPYGEWGSRKYLLASLDQSLQRMGLDYVDIFYSHRLDPDTPLEETLGAVDTAVKQGKALYAGISSYSGPRTAEAVRIFEELGTPLLIHQPSLLPAQPLDRGGPARGAGGGGRRLHRLLPARPGHADHEVPRRRPRALARGRGHVPEESFLTEENLNRVRALNEIAQDRGQTLAQMAIAWVLRDPRITSALIGARTVEQLEDSLGALDNLDFPPDELPGIDGTRSRRASPVGGVERELSDVRLEPWSEADLDLLRGLVGDPAMMVHLGGPETEAKVAERHGRYAQPGSNQFKIVAGGEGAGWVGYWERDDVWEIGWAVLPSFQGRGLATAATALALDRAREEGSRRFVTRTRPSTTRPRTRSAAGSASSSSATTSSSSRPGSSCAATTGASTWAEYANIRSCTSSSMPTRPSPSSTAPRCPTSWRPRRWSSGMTPSR